MIRIARGFKSFRFAGALAGAVIACGFAAPSWSQSATVMKLATATVNDVQVEAIKRYAARIEARTNGRIKTQLFPAAQLGSNPRMIEGLQLGTVEVYVGPPTYLAGIDPRFQVLDAPGVFADFAHAARTMRDPAFRDVFLALGESKGLKGVALFMYGPTAFATKKPLRTLNDFRGQKLRVLGSRIEREAAGKLGATAVPIDFSEVTPALQQGTIDGMKSGMSVFTSIKIYDIVKYVTETHEAVIPEVMMVSKKWFDSQPADVQAILIEEGKALEPELNDFTFAAQIAARKQWQEKGGEVITLSAADRAEMMRRLAGVGHDVFADNPQQKQMFELLLKVTQANKK